MIRWLFLLALMLAALHAEPRFVVYDLYLNPQSDPLAAYQVKITATQGAVKIISIEGGEHPAYQDPPIYDPKAIQNDVVILAAIGSGRSLPTRKIRVASLHIQVEGTQEPKFRVILQRAVSFSGEPMDIPVSLKPR